MGLSPAERLLLERRLARKRGRGGRVVLAIVLLAAALPIAGVVAGAVAAGVTYGLLAEELDEGLQDVANLRTRQTFQSIRIYDRNGILLREVFNEGRRTRVPLSALPRHMLQATIAVEDASFYQNAGVDPFAVARAVWQMVSQGQVVSGASTITQQYVRHIAFSDAERLARDYGRKAKEIVLALVMTRRYSKDEILEGYLNEIYYGNLAYGIEAASSVIFDKTATDLTLAEAAMLAGLPQSPYAYDPLDPDPDVQRLVRSRQRTVLNLMVESGYISSKEADAAAEEELVYRDPGKDTFLAPHFVVYVTQLLEEEIGAERMALGGLDIHTTLDLPLQAEAQTIVRDRVESVRERHNLTSAAVVALEPRTGQILAMVGSKDYWDDAIDGRVNVAVRLRQPGSSIKPVTYATALEEGIPPWTYVWDVPMERSTPQGLYTPVNYDGVFHGPVRLREALANSYNIPALKVLERVGVREMIQTANRMGITTLDPDSDRYGLSLTLGGGEVTLLDLTTAFGTLANGGGMVRPNPFLRITDSDGNVLYQRAADQASLEPVPAVSPETAYIVSDWLSDNAARAPAFGSSSPLNVSVKAAVKTGTTNDYRDNWTVGYTPYLAVGVWAGNADNSAMRRSSGVTGAAPIWHDVVEAVVDSDERMAMMRTARESMGIPFERSFQRPNSVGERSVCALRSLNNLGPACSEFRTELTTKSAAQAPPAPGAEGSPAQPGQSGEGLLDSWIVVPAVAVPSAPPAPAEGVEAPPWQPAVLCSASGPGGGMDRMFAVAVLPLPTDAEEREDVQSWAARSGWVALEPSTFCSPDMVAQAMDLGVGAVWAGGPDGRPSARVDYRLGITPGTVLTQTTSITGTVSFDPSAVDYYKLELGAGDEPTEWITVGSTHDDYIVNGPIEVLSAPSLAPGPYVLRLVLVKDGDFIQPPFSVPIVIGR